MISEKRIHGGQVNPRALDAFLAQEESSLKPAGFGKNALKENSPHTLFLFLSSWYLGTQYWAGWCFHVVLFHFGVMSSKPQTDFVKKFCTT